MKKTFLLLLLFPIAGFAQHLKFMGIPIDGAPNSFGKQLQAKEFTQQQQLNGFKTDTNYLNMFFKGKFTGKDVLIDVISSTITNNVCRVCVIFDEREKDSSDVEEHFKKLKEHYSIKYEFDTIKYKTTEKEHYFTRPHREHDKLKIKKWVYFKAEYGTIYLITDYSSIIAVYSDSSNVEEDKKLRDSKKLEDI